MVKKLSNYKRRKIVNRIKYDILYGSRKISDRQEARIVIQAEIDFNLAREQARLNNTLTTDVEKSLHMERRNKITTGLKELELMYY